MKYLTTITVIVLVLVGVTYAAAPTPGDSLNAAFVQVQEQIDSLFAKDVEQDARLDALENASPPSSTCVANTQYNAEYFNNTTLTGPAILNRCEPRPLNNSWGSGGPGSGVNTNLFSARYTNNFDFPAGNYTFTITADDGVRVWVGQEQILDRWVDQSPTTYSVPFTSTGGIYAVRIEFYENTGTAIIAVNWVVNQPPGSGGG